MTRRASPRAPRSPVPTEAPASDATPADRIAKTLRLRGPSTAAEISSEHGCGVVAVRAQLRNMESAGYVTRAAERRAIGRPVSRYALAPGAEGFFPKRYDKLAERLVDAVVEEFGEEGLERILARWEEGLVRRFEATLPTEPSARLDALASHQTQNGFMASVQRDEDGVALVERNCPIAAVASRYPQICRHEAALFSRTLKWKTTLRACQATGDAVCVFQIGRGRSPESGRPPDAERKES
jgi:predicted ArsR family transcriptional regulator